MAKNRLVEASEETERLISKAQEVDNSSNGLIIDEKTCESLRRLRA